MEIQGKLIIVTGASQGGLLRKNYMLHHKSQKEELIVHETAVEGRWTSVGAICRDILIFWKVFEIKFRLKNVYNTYLRKSSKGNHSAS